MLLLLPRPHELATPLPGSLDFIRAGFNSAEGAVILTYALVFLAHLPANPRLLLSREQALGLRLPQAPSLLFSLVPKVPLSLPQALDRASFCWSKIPLFLSSLPAAPTALLSVTPSRQQKPLDDPELHLRNSSFPQNPATDPPLRSSSPSASSDADFPSLLHSSTRSSLLLLPHATETHLSASSRSPSTELHLQHFTRRLFPPNRDLPSSFSVPHIFPVIPELFIPVIDSSLSTSPLFLVARPKFPSPPSSLATPPYLNPNLLHCSSPP